MRIVCLLCLVTVLGWQLVGCSGVGPQLPLEQGEATAGPHHVGVELDRLVETLTTEADSKAVWGLLSEAQKQQLWSALLQGEPYPAGEIELMRASSFLERECTAPPSPLRDRDAALWLQNVRDTGLAWQAERATIANAAPFESTVAADLPDRVQNAYQNSSPVSREIISQGVGFDVTREFRLPGTANPYAIPPDTIAYVVPVLLYCSTSYDIWGARAWREPQALGQGTAYQYNRVALLLFGVR